MLTAKEIRESFKTFFAGKGHHIVPSAPMVIKDDPTLMFTNAGMNQFKDIILGNKAAKYPRVADSQKCLRVSGKHNDLEEVGMDTYHHTMFEMLGNWSFGDYFKQEAIDWAWEYLVDVLKLDPERLYATVFEGAPDEGLSRDDEAAAIWERHLPADHIINGNKHDNFWEMGGQTGDRGTLTDTATGRSIDIYDTKRENGVGVHLTTTLPADPAADFRAAIDTEARMATSRNHSATHLLHQALREVLGTHVEQKGSFVSPEVLRFDFSHFQKLTPEEIRKVEHLANKRVRQAMACDEKRCVPIAEAREMGAMALFGEKYGDEVRVIRYGDSVELCGGTHVPNTGNIGMIRILSESSIAAGIRRIEAITGSKVEDFIDSVSDTLYQIGAMFNNAPDVLGALRKSIEENATLRKQAEEYFAERVVNMTVQLMQQATYLGDIALVELKGPRLPEMVKNIAFEVRKRAKQPTAFVGATFDQAGKPLLTVMLTDDIVNSGKNASALVRSAAKAIKGGGGGQPGFAQAGGKDMDGLGEAFNTIINELKA